MGLIKGFKRHLNVRRSTDVPKSVERISGSPIRTESDIRHILAAGDYFYNKKEFSSALANYEKVIDFAPRKKKVWFKIGECYFALADYENAVNSYDNFLRYKAAIGSVNPNFHDKNELIATEKIKKAKDKLPKQKIQFSDVEKKNSSIPKQNTEKGYKKGLINNKLLKQDLILGRCRFIF